jgi:hypothetical protein
MVSFGQFSLAYKLSAANHQRPQSHDEISIQVYRGVQECTPVYGDSFCSAFWQESCESRLA